MTDFDRRAPGHARIHPTPDGRWRIAYDGTAALTFDEQKHALMAVPEGWSFEIDPAPTEGTEPWSD